VDAIDSFAGRKDPHSAAHSDEKGAPMSAAGLLNAGASLAVGMLTAASCFAAGATDPLLAYKDSMLCFRRDYSAEHLAQHPKQTIRSVLLADQGGFINIVLTSRIGATHEIAAGCGWTPTGAGIDTSNRKMIPAFTGSAAYDCIVTVGASDVEGGYLLIEPARDATTMTVYIQSPITTVDVEYQKAMAYNLKLGSEDVTFELLRIRPEPCARFKAKSN
jgi:hypothetical protein